MAGFLHLSPTIKSTDLPKDFEKARSKLIECIKSSIGPNRRYHDKECEEFYIGTSTICEQWRLDLDPDEPHTWDDKLIRERWYEHREDGYQVMAVLTVVTKKNLPLKQHSHKQYTLGLKKDLIEHFKKDKRFKTTPTAPESPLETGAAYVLYLAMKIWPKFVVPLNEYTASLINLPHSYNKSLRHIKSIIAANEKYYYTKCEEFYIGKSTINTLSRPSIFRPSRQHFDPDDRDTWDDNLLNKQWYEHRKDGYEAMVVLIVVTEETLPQDSCKQYTLELKEDLIMHFQDEKDKRLKTTPTAPESPLESGAAYALYLAMKFGPSLVVPLYDLSYPLIKLPKDYNKSLSKLIERIDSIVEANEKYHSKKCEGFYIGKSTIREWSSPCFDPDKPDTWDGKLIHDCWKKHSRKDGYQAMAVLTVVTYETLPPLWSQSPDVCKEQYTVALKQGLITHFMFVEEDERLANDDTVPGKFAGRDAKAHVLYLAMKFKQ